jgi:hypothetical protein
VDALLSQAQSALRASPGARAYYAKQRARDLEHNAALRQLANRLVGILHGCLTAGSTESGPVTSQSGSAPAGQVERNSIGASRTCAARLGRRANDALTTSLSAALICSFFDRGERPTVPARAATRSSRSTRLSHRVTVGGTCEGVGRSRS